MFKRASRAKLDFTQKKVCAVHNSEFCSFIKIRNIILCLSHHILYTFINTVHCTGVYRFQNYIFYRFLTNNLPTRDAPKRGTLNNLTSFGNIIFLQKFAYIYLKRQYSCAQLLFQKSKKFTQDQFCLQNILSAEFSQNILYCTIYKKS